MTAQRHSIKIRRAQGIAAIGRYTRTWRAIIDAMPREAITACTAKQIAKIADAMRKEYEIGHTTGYRDATE